MIKRLSVLTLSFFVFAYLALMGVMYVFQRDLQYHPSNEEKQPADLSLNVYTAERLKTADGESIVIWHKPAPEGQPTIMYLHGNAGSLGTRPRKLDFLAQSQFGVLAVDYRGYGGSSGEPSEAGMVLDAVTAYEWLAAKGVDPRDVMLLGESIGSGIAVQLAAAKQVAAVALEAPYANAVDIGAERYWYLPVRLLMKDQFRSSEHIANIKAPLFIIHGTEDFVVPFKQGELLFSFAVEPKTFEPVAGADHDMIGEEAIWAKWMAFFEGVKNSRVAQ
jgi:uncharacterized protein